MTFDTSNQIKHQIMT